MTKQVNGMEQEGYIEFTKVHAFFLVCSILTYIGDIILDIVLAVTYLQSGYYWYCLITVILTLFPSLAVQVFSVRWHQLDELMSKSFWIIHAALLGVVQRYCIVINLGFTARKTKLPLDYERYYQHQSDVCMLRLFDSFLESAPQLVFHLYVMIEKQKEWRVEEAVWTAISALTSMISLGWGIAAYSSAMRMVKAEKRKMTWMGMILQTIWRFGMLSARIVALVLLTLALKEWVIIVLFAHWLLMTGWVICQETDFCETIWEERFYNAIVGVIYCFCFFNLKEGQSRFRATTFYFVIILENFFFLAIYFYLTDFGGNSFTKGMSIGAFVIMTVGTATGITAMLLYYRYFHPVGPINPCLEYAESSEKNNVLFTGGETQGDSASFHDRSRGPDFEIQSEDVFNSPGSGHELETPPRPPPRRSRVQHSRSFKDSCPPAKRSQTPKKPKKSNHKRRMAEAAAAATRESSCSPVGVKSPAVLEEPVESAYGTDSNRTVSRSTVSPPLHSPSSHTDDQNDSGTSSADANKSSGSGKSAAFNNDTYMSVENAERQSNDPAKKSTNNTYMSVKSPSTGPQANQSNELELSRSLSQCSQPSIDSRITVIERADLVMKTPEKKSTDDQPEKLLKRSPIVKDVTSGFAQVMSTASLKSQGSCNQPGPIPPRKRDGLTAPLTIIIPNISHQAITRSKSGDLPSHQQQQTPGAASEEITTERLDPNREGNIDSLSAHDYENLALININRTALGVTHWRTYSDMANSKHDESTAYERQKLSKTSNSDYSNYNSLQYYDIYPLSKEIKQQLYRSLTPVSSTAATMATSDTATNVTDSDTYEPIESFAPGAWINQFPDGANASGNLSSLSSNSSSGIPVTLIHHDGEKLTTKQIISLDNLKDVLKKHETVPMDDPQDRGDLYLLAPMRLLTPILEESESDSTRTTDPSYNNVAYGNQLNKSIMTVISEMLGSVSGTRPPLQPFPKSTAGAMANESFGQMSADGRFPESIESTSSLVHTIDEIRNNSLCNLFFSSVADLGSPAPKNNSQSAAPQVPPRNSPPVKPTPLLISPSANNTSTSVQPSTSKSISETPVTTNRPSFENDDEKENVVNSVPPEARNKKISPLVFGIGSRQNILEMTAGKTTNHILNTPSKKSNPNKLSLPVAVASAQVTVPLPLPSLETNDINTQGVLRESTSSGIVSQNSSLHSIRQQNMTLSPSRKYDETPTPPLRDRQFIRNSQLNRPRRKFSIIRDKFESDNEDSPNPVRRFGTNSNADLYENVSDDLLNNDLSHISKMSSSTPSFIDSKDFELKPDDKYENLHRGWATSSMQKPGVRGWNPQQPGAPKQQQQQQRTQSNNNPNRRSMSGIDNYYAASTARFVDNKTDRKSVVGIEHVRSLGKENRQVEENPPELKPKPSQPITRTSRMPLLSPGSKLRSRILTGSPQRTYRVSSLSPQSKIFTKK